MALISLNLDSIEDYRKFIKIKALPSYRFSGRTAEVPDEYLHLIDPEFVPITHDAYRPIEGLWDYQMDIANIAINKRKYAAFLDCGLGKSIIITEFARHVNAIIAPSRRTLIITPLMVIPQMIGEFNRFYINNGYCDQVVESISASRLESWIQEPGEAIGITNYEAIKDHIPQGRLGALILDESQALRSIGGVHARNIQRLGSGLEWKLCASGTPAPNDRIEYAQHAVFLDVFPTTNSFMAKFFCNRAKKGVKWELKPHAVKEFYRSMSHWAIFMENPDTYGWKDNTSTIPELEIHIEHVDLIREQQQYARQETGMLFPVRIGGFVKRGKLSKIAKGWIGDRKIATNKVKWIKDSIDSWSDGESTILWVHHNDEQAEMERLFPHAASIQGSTKLFKRFDLIADFQAGVRKILISKPKVLGFGLNLQVATRHVFGGLNDSYEQMYQAIKRSNRYGSKYKLNVHIPITEIEVPILENVLSKAETIREDSGVQERMFRDLSNDYQVWRRESDFSYLPKSPIPIPPAEPSMEDVEVPELEESLSNADVSDDVIQEFEI